MNKVGCLKKVVIIFLLFIVGFIISVIVFTVDEQSNKQNNEFIEIVPVADELQKLCRKKFSEEYYCGVGEWTSNSKDTALQMAILHAKGEMASSINTYVIDSVGYRFTLTDSVSERITGIRVHTKINNIGNKMKNSEICTIDNIEGKVSLVRVSEDSEYYIENDYAYIHYILVNGKIVGSCTYQKNVESEYEFYTVKVGEGISGIQTKETRTIYNKDNKKYTVYVLITLPKTLVDEQKREQGEQK